jgi:site-specific DNA-cytosine methylase
MKSDIKLLYIDLFCGAGGTSTGVEKATFHGEKCAKVIACVNHDANAIASHAAKMKAATKQEQSSSLELPSTSRFGEAKEAEEADKSKT